MRLCKWLSNSEQLVAIKKMKKKDVIKKNEIEHIKAERTILSKSANKWIIDLYCSFQDEDSLYLVMEYMPGGDLMNMLIKKDIFSIEEARFYIAEIILAVEYVHTLGFVHRDIKPDNILLDKDGHIKVTDFGLCTSMVLPADQFGGDGEERSSPRGNKENNYQETLAAYRQNRKKMHSLVGTPDYIAPEVFNKNGYTEIVDWWSVGAILFEMLVGYAPFCSDNPKETCRKVIQWRKHLQIPPNIQVPREAADLIMRLMSEERILL